MSDPGEENNREANKGEAAKDGLGFLVADVFRLMRREFGRRLDATELTFAQARALVYIARHEGTRQVDLAEMLDIAPMTLARQIDQLESVGYVERRADAKDRRAYLMHLTPAASAPLNAISDVIAAVRQDALTGLTSAEAAAVTAGLRKMRQNLVEVQ